MGEANFEGIRKYVTRRQNTVAQYIAIKPILELCKRSTWRPGARLSWRWWEQSGIDLEGAKKRETEAVVLGIKRRQGWRGGVKGRERFERSGVD